MVRHRSRLPTIELVGWGSSRATAGPGQLVGPQRVGYLLHGWLAGMDATGNELHQLAEIATGRLLNPGRNDDLPCPPALGDIAVVISAALGRPVSQGTRSAPARPGPSRAQARSSWARGQRGGRVGHRSHEELVLPPSEPGRSRGTQERRQCRGPASATMRVGVVASLPWGPAVQTRSTRH